MNFNLYNLLSHLIPGFIIYAAGLQVLNHDPDYFPIIMATAIAYVLGYFINSLGGWIEGIIFWTWGGKPSVQVLNGKCCGRIKFAETKKAKQLLQKIAGSRKMSVDDLFQIAMRVSDNEGRISEMNAHYAFSRSLLVSLLISTAILSKEYWSNYLFWIIAFLIVLAAWYRAKERGFYYAREVLMVSLNKNKN